MPHKQTQIWLFHNNGGYRLNIWDLSAGKLITQFTTGGKIIPCVVAANETIIVGVGLGHVQFLGIVKPN